MIYNKFDLNFIFIHIPKCGGSIIEKSLGVDYNKSIGFDFEHHHQNVFNSKYFKILHYKNILGEEFKKYFSFTLIRNPWERMVSNYLSDLTSNDVSLNGNIKYDDKKDITFEQYLDIIYNNDMGIFVQDYQSWYRDVDYVCKFENIQSDFSYVCGRLGIDNRALEYTDKTYQSKYNYKDYYNSKTKDIIFKNFKYDILKYKYEF
jgi:chondroitin 4-sulfotransferase 11